MKFETLRYEQDDHIAVVTMNRPEARNAYDDRMQGELNTVWRHVRGNPEIWAIVLTGAGTDAFCAGRDVKELNRFQERGELVPRYDPQNPEYGDFGAHIHKYEIGKPIIGAINGAAVGGGLGMVLTCDLRVMSEDAWLGDLHVNIGQVGGSARLALALPDAIAAELVLLGARVSAQRAYEVGFVNRVVPQDQVLAEAMRMAKKICEMSPLAVHRSKESMTALKQVPPGVRDLEEHYMSATRLSEDGKEGPLAFREKRRPVWTGR